MQNMNELLRIGCNAIITNNHKFQRLNAPPQVTVPQMLSVPIAVSRAALSHIIRQRATERADRVADKTHYHGNLEHVYISLPRNSGTEKRIAPQQ